MGEVSTIGLDLAKHVFQVHGIDEVGQVVVRKQLRRAAVAKFFAKLAPCTVGIEACASAHYWAREIAATGHTVKLMPPAYVKPYVKRGKNDMADAEAICEAVMRPTMRFVPVKSAEQQANAMIYKVRDLLVRQRTQLINSLRSHLAELGIVAARGMSKLEDLIAVVRDQSDDRLPPVARQALQEFVGQIEALNARIDPLEQEIVSQVRTSEAGRRLASVPSVGPIIAGALLAMVPDPGGFRSARHFATWLGFAPRQKSTGGKQRLGSISKRGNRHLRSLLILGAANVLRRRNSVLRSAWLTALRGRRPFKVAAVALAHKTARIVWALMVKGGTYRAAVPAVATS
jgi:transposase